MHIYKKGDRVKCIAPVDGNKDFVGLEGYIYWDSFEMSGTRRLPVTVAFDNGRYWGCELENIKLINEKHMASLQDKVKMAFKSEPTKTLIRAGILDARDNFTAEGVSVFLDFLLAKYGEEFKTKIADVVLAEEKESKVE